MFFFIYFNKYEPRTGLLLFDLFRFNIVVTAFSVKWFLKFYNLHKNEKNVNILLLLIYLKINY